MTEPIIFGKYYSDSLFVEPEPEHFVPSFITDGFDKVIEPLERVSSNILNGWDLAILAAVLLLIIVNKQIYPRQFIQIFSVFKGTSQTNQLLREWTPIQSFINFSLQVSLSLVFAMFIQKSVVVLSFSDEYNTLPIYLIISFVVLALIVLRHLVMLAVEKIFDLPDVFDRQSAVDLATKTVLLLLLVPIVLLLLYNPYSPFVMIGVGVSLATFLTRVVYEFVETRVFVKISSFYIFLYLCALEIIPVLVIVVACYRLLKTGSVF